MAVFAAPSEGWLSVPSTCAWGLSMTCSSSSRASDTVFCSAQIPACTHSHMYTDRAYMNIHTHANKYINLLKRTMRAMEDGKKGVPIVWGRMN